MTETLRRASRPLTAAEVALKTGLSRVSARRYLTHYVERHQATRMCRYGRPGRPEYRYMWVE